MNVILCEAPCCPGLRQYVTNDAPHLGLVIACQVQRQGRRSNYPLPGQNTLGRNTLLLL